jgi:hypothetical protein
MSRIAPVDVTVVLRGKSSIARPYNLFMHTRKHTVGRNILRIFEIALFFAVSVLGYGLLMKASSSQTKSKSRDQAACCQKSLNLNGLHRELKIISGTLLFPSEQALPDNTSAIAHATGAFHALHSPAPRFTPSSAFFQYRDDPGRTSLPCNLLQLNPVLLV